MMSRKQITNLFRGTSARGETSELRAGLVSQFAIERKDAIERTIHAMTLGKDVSGLFPDILKNLATHDLDQKKLVYLYLMNYAKTHPELVILAVNTFVQDSEDPNPLVRALAIRTMSCIRVDKMVDFLPLPLEKTLSDENPYVRKTAAIAVAKLFDLDPEMALERGLLPKLQALLDDSNPMVIANAVNALEEIQKRFPATNAFEVTPEMLEKLLGALNECTEWGRLTILTAFSEYNTSSETEADHICERVVPQFQHANPAVVLMAIRAVLAHLHLLPTERQHELQKKLSSPLVTLLATPPELQYVALRNMRIILQKYPGLLRRDVKVFYCKYKDPLYLKLEKIEVLMHLVSAKNASAIVAELKEYATEVDVVFVRRAVKALGQVAVTVESSAELVVDTLLDFLDHRVPYVTQEVAIVLAEILRKYRTFEDAIPRLCDSIEEFEESEARAAVVWILGEYAENIPPVRSLIAPFVKTFLEESTAVQLQLLTATTKLYIKRPEDAKDLIKDLFETATQKSDNADVRDRAYIYWRLLSTEDLAKKVVLAARPPVSGTLKLLPDQLLAELLPQLSTLASVYHQSPAAVDGEGKYATDRVRQKALDEQRQLAREEGILNAENLLDLDDGEEKSENVLSDIFTSNASSNISSAATQDILSLFAPQSKAAASSANTANGSSELGGLGGLGGLGEASEPAQKPSNDDLLGLF